MNQSGADADSVAAADLFQTALAAHREGDFTGALQGYMRCVEADPRNASAWLNRGVVQLALGDEPAAERYYLTALALLDGSPDAHMAHNNLCRLYTHQGRVDCIAHGRRAVVLKPDHAGNWLNLGSALYAGGEMDEAMGCYRRAAGLGDPDAPGALYKIKRVACDWVEPAQRAELDALEQRLLGDPTAPLALFEYFAYLPSSGIGQRRRAEAWAARFRFPYHCAPGATHRVEGRKIRLGYLSADFHSHATAHLIAQTLERHDRTRFEVHAFSYGPPYGDEMQQRIIRAVDVFHDVRMMTDAMIAERIHALGIDVLLDLKGPTQWSRAGIVARRPAPIQINYLGWPGTLGAPFIDYLIADPLVAPQADEFSEQLLYLDCYQPTDSGKRIPLAPGRAELDLPEDALVLCSANAAYKLSPALLDCWLRILRELPHAVLWLLETNPVMARNLRALFEQHGLEAQLRLMPPLPYAAHLDRLAAADLALDTFPCGGHTTTSDLLWAGVPVLTCCGDSFVARVSSSLASAAGLAELVTRDLHAYTELALELGRDSSRLRALKQQLVATRHSQLLFDNERYTRTLEARLLEITGNG